MKCEPVAGPGSGVASEETVSHHGSAGVAPTRVRVVAESVRLDSWCALGGYDR